MQNAGLASGLALAMGKLATAGLAPAIFGPVMNISGSLLASWWHNHPPEAEVDTERSRSISDDNVERSRNVALRSKK
jgi:BASS family bile acid:Na+ symporter